MAEEKTLGKAKLFVVVLAGLVSSTAIAADYASPEGGEAIVAKTAKAAAADYILQVMRYWGIEGGNFSLAMSVGYLFHSRCLLTWQFGASLGE